MRNLSKLVKADVGQHKFHYRWLIWNAMSCLVYLLKLPELNFFQRHTPIWIKLVYHLQKTFQLFGCFSVENMAILQKIYEQQLIAVVFVVSISNVVLVIQPVQLDELLFGLLVQFALCVILWVRVQYFLQFCYDLYILFSLLDFSLWVAVD